MFKFEVYENMRNIKDSMQLDSNTDICKLETDQGVITIEVRGYVKVEFKGYVYTQPSDFPQELKDIIAREPNICDTNDDVEIYENNWFEIFYNGDEFYDTIDIEGYTELELLTACLEMLDESQK